MLQQMIRAARLDRKLYTEVYFDSAATGNAVMIVALVSAVVFLAVRVFGRGLGFSDFYLLLQAVVFAVAGWIAVSLLIWLAATKVFDAVAMPQTALRVFGFAHVPLIVQALPLPGVIELVIGLAWYLAALVVATEVAFDLDLKNSVAACLMGLGGLALIALVLSFPAPILGIG